jgi:dTMP kinase
VTGRYVALEGVEGAGKSTVAALLVGRIRVRGEEAITVREPGGTELGEEIRRLLLHSGDMTPWAEAALFAAARAQLAVEVVRPALERGAWVVSDRSYYSSLAYQGGARGLGIDEVRSLNEAVLMEVLPDHVIVIDVDPEVGLLREDGVDRISSAGLDFQMAVADAYRAIRDSGDTKVRFVPGQETPDSIVDRILGMIS